MKVFVFSATGNSLYVARRIGGELYSIPQLLKEDNLAFEDEAIGFVFPCHGFGLPRLMTDFLRRARFKADYFFAVMTYGNKAGAGLRHLEEAGRAAGIAFDYTNELLMVDNYLPLFKIEDQLKKEPAKKIEERLELIVSDIAARRKKLAGKGYASTVISKLVHSIFINKQVDAGDRQFGVDAACNGCKVCEKVCPKGNIRVERQPQFLHRCDGCYACIHHCPQTALHVKYERSGARFINRHVTLQDIIAANNQS